MQFKFTENFGGDNFGNSGEPHLVDGVERGVETVELSPEEFAKLFNAAPRSVAEIPALTEKMAA